MSVFHFWVYKDLNQEIPSFTPAFLKVYLNDLLQLLKS